MNEHGSATMLSVGDLLLSSPSRSALVMDFDGVLAPIVDDPTASRMVEGTGHILGRLAHALGLVGIISGRPADFLIDRAGVPGVVLLGSYGLEQVREGKPFPDPAAADWLKTVANATEELRHRLDALPGVRVERKSLSVAVHWRQAEDPQAAEAVVHLAVSQLAHTTGLLQKPGKLVEELLIPLDQDKGTALSSLVAGRDLSCVAYAGDDLGDLPAMRAVRAMGGVALAVTHGGETPPELRPAADLAFPGVEAFTGWLQQLADRLST
jgi:trehalose 6-phosphate phosphatase